MSGGLFAPGAISSSDFRQTVGGLTRFAGYLFGVSPQSSIADRISSPSVSLSRDTCSLGSRQRCITAQFGRRNATRFVEKMRRLCE